MKQLVLLAVMGSSFLSFSMFAMDNQPQQVTLSAEQIVDVEYILKKIKKGIELINSDAPSAQVRAARILHKSNRRLTQLKKTSENL